MAEQERIEILVSLRDTLSKAAKIVEKAIDDIGDSATDTSGDLEVLDGRLKKTGRTSVKTGAQAKVAAGGIEDIGDEALKSSVKLRLLMKRMGKVNGNGSSGLGRFIRVGKAFRRLALVALIGLVADAVGILATALAGLGAAAIAALAGLSPLSGLLVAYPGFLAAFIQGMGLAKFATHGLREAIIDLLTPGISPEDLAKTLGRLGPEGQKFARAVASLRPEMMKLKSDIQEGILPGFTKLVQLFKNSYFDIFAKGMRDGVKVVNGFTDKLEAFLKTAKAQERFGKIMENNNKILGNFGDAGIYLFEALMDILDAAGPMLIELSKSISKFFENIRNYTDKNKAGLTEFFNNALAVAKKVYAFLKNIAIGFGNIGKAAMPLAKDMGTALMGISERFKAITGSESGQKKLREFFAKMKPVIWEMGYLLRDVGKAIIDIGTDPSFVKTIKEIRTDLLPALVEFIKAVNEGNFIASFSKLLSGLAKFGKETGLFGTLGDIFKGIGWALEQIAYAFSGIPGPIKKVISYFLIFALLGAKLKFLKVLLNLIVSPLKWIAGLFGRLAGWLFRTTGYFSRFAKFAPLIGKIGLKFVPIIGWVSTLVMVMGWLNKKFGIFSKMWNGLKGAGSWIAGKLGFGDEKVEGAKAMGGPVLAGKRYLVGELGPEAFLSNSGQLSMIGKSGPQLMDFNKSGTVIPNHLLSAISNAGDKNHQAMMALAGGTKSIPSNKGNSNNNGDLSVSIGNITVNQASDFDVVRAVRKGIVEAERDRRERR